MEILIERNQSAPGNTDYEATTIGSLSFVPDEHFCFTLEPTDLMISPGTYPVQLSWSPRFNRNTPWLTVPGRTDIEIHGVNFAIDSEGCISVGMKQLSVYEIDDTPPATDEIEAALKAAEARGEVSTVVITSVVPVPD